MRFPTFDEVIACNEAVRAPDEVSPSADEDDLGLVRRALERAQSDLDPVDVAAALLYEIVAAQGFFEGNNGLQSSLRVGADEHRSEPEPRDAAPTVARDR